MDGVYRSFEAEIPYRADTGSWLLSIHFDQQVQGRPPEVHYVTQIGYSTLARILEARREETLRDLKQRIQDAREEWTWTNEVRDTADSSELDGREDIELGLIRLKIDTLRRINEALSRLHHGTYGCCVDCRSRISELRLRALPFAVRCRECEERHERAEQSVRAVAARQRLSASVVEVSDWRPRSQARSE
jgi:DnaK suppressor protein